MRRVMRSGEDGTLLFAMLLGNQNNNDAANGANNTTPSSGTLEIRHSSTVLEFEPLHETFRAIGQAIELKDTGDTLGAENLQFWEQNGYLVIKEALQHNQLAQLQAELMDVVERLSIDEDPLRKEHHIMSANGTNEGDQTVVNPNGRLIAILTTDPGNTDQRLNSLQRIRRMGTGVHRVLPSFRSMTFSRFHQKIASLLGFEDPRVTQSMVVTKPRGVGAEIIPHQDSCSCFTDPPSAVTFWYALQDTSYENGCLKVVPGSHRTEPLTMRTKLNDLGFPEIVDLPEPVYATQHRDDQLVQQLSPVTGPDGEYLYKSLEVKAGTLVLMHGNLVHASDANRSTTSDRLAYNFTVVEGKLPWPKDSYLQPYEGESEFEKLEQKV